MECELCDYRLATELVSDGAYEFFVCANCSEALGESWVVMAEADVRA